MAMGSGVEKMRMSMRLDRRDLGSGGKEVDKDEEVMRLNSVGKA